MTARRRPPVRRRSETIRFDHVHPDSGVAHAHYATVGYYDDGGVAEVFIDTRKQSSDSANLARDAALVLSIAIQYGASVEEMREAISRTERGLPHTVIGSVLDLLVSEAKTGRST